MSNLSGFSFIVILLIVGCNDENSIEIEQRLIASGSIEVEPDSSKSNSTEIEDTIISETQFVANSYVPKNEDNISNALKNFLKNIDKDVSYSIKSSKERGIFVREYRSDYDNHVYFNEDIELELSQAWIEKSAGKYRLVVLFKNHISSLASLGNLYIGRKKEWRLIKNTILKLDSLPKGNIMTFPVVKGNPFNSNRSKSKMESAFSITLWSTDTRTVKQLLNMTKPFISINSKWKMQIFNEPSCFNEIIFRDNYSFEDYELCEMGSESFGYYLTFDDTLELNYIKIEGHDEGFEPYNRKKNI